MRALRADEIEVRVAQCNQNGVTLLLYKDSRCDMRILDETFGIWGWRDSYQSVNGELFCTIEVWDDSKVQWIAKQSNGTPSNMEAEKGRASDAFKRAGFMLGIGRELYTAPFIYVPADKCNIKKGENGRYKCYDKFICEKVRIEGGQITGLSIYNNTKGCRAYVCTIEKKGE